MKLLPILLLAAASLTLTACDSVDPNSPLGKRKALFQQMLDHSEDLGGMLRGRIPFKEEDFRAKAIQLDELSRQPWQHFPQVREESSKARDELWQKQETFQRLSRDLEAATGALATAARAERLKQRELKAPVDQVEKTCKACHEEFRVY
jgi:cytochrome c556